MSPPAALACFAQVVEQIEDLHGVVATVEDIAELNHHEITADPAIIFVGGAGEPERGARRLEIAVEIADRHQPLHARETSGNVEQ